jgi:hypothetical protein
MVDNGQELNDNAPV